MGTPTSQRWRFLFEHAGEQTVSSFPSLFWRSYSSSFVSDSEGAQSCECKIGQRNLSGATFGSRRGAYHCPGTTTGLALNSARRRRSRAAVEAVELSVWRAGVSRSVPLVNAPRDPPDPPCTARSGRDCPTPISPIGWGRGQYESLTSYPAASASSGMTNAPVCLISPPDVGLVPRCYAG